MVTAPVEAVSPDAELERFRREWEQEVKQRRQGPQQGVSSPPTRKQAITVEVEEEPTSPEKQKIAWREGDGSIREVLAGLRLEEVELEEDDSPVASTSKAASPPVRTKPLSPTKYTHLLPTATKLRSIAATKAADAVVLYSRAVEAEQTGRLNEALALYRRAFRLDGECCHCCADDRRCG
jgi:F-box protein 9